MCCKMSGKHCLCGIKYGQVCLASCSAVCPWLKVGILDFYFKVSGMSKPVISPV